MIISSRVRARMKALDLTGTEVARRVGITQGAMAKIANNDPNGSSKLHLIARVLQTTPEYLTGEIDDPAIGAPPPPPAEPQVVLMGVVMPAEAALAQMFEALLAGIDREATLGEQALLLARRLPTGLSQLRDLRPASNRAPARRQAPAAAPAALAMPDREPTR